MVEQGSVFRFPPPAPTCKSRGHPFGASVLTDLIGAHAVLGAFVSGIVIGQAPILTRHIQDQLSGLIVALFMPVLFAAAGRVTSAILVNRVNAYTLKLIP